MLISKPSPASQSALSATKKSASLPQVPTTGPFPSGALIKSSPSTACRPPIVKSTV